MEKKQENPIIASEEVLCVRAELGEAINIDMEKPLLRHILQNDIIDYLISMLQEGREKATDRLVEFFEFLEKEEARCIGATVVFCAYRTEQVKLKENKNDETD